MPAHKHYLIFNQSIDFPPLKSEKKIKLCYFYINKIHQNVVTQIYNLSYLVYFLTLYKEAQFPPNLRVHARKNTCNSILRSGVLCTISNSNDLIKKNKKSFYGANSTKFMILDYFFRRQVESFRLNPGV